MGLTDDDEVTDGPPQVEDSSERGFVPRSKRTQDPVTYADLGQSDDRDPVDEGDIADEGRGHRG